MKGSRPVNTAAELKAILGDLRRLRILEILTGQQASVKQLSEMIDETPQTTHYHTKQLEAAGLIEIVEKREVRGALEKFYRAVADRFLISREIGLGPDHALFTAWGDIVQEWLHLGDWHLATLKEEPVMFTTVQAAETGREAMTPTSA